VVPLLAGTVDCAEARRPFRKNILSNLFSQTSVERQLLLRLEGSFDSLLEASFGKWEKKGFACAVGKRKAPPCLKRDT
jgi:hypothetical protein